MVVTVTGLPEGRNGHLNLEAVGQQLIDGGVADENPEGGGSRIRIERANLFVLALLGIGSQLRGGMARRNFDNLAADDFGTGVTRADDDDAVLRTDLGERIFRCGNLAVELLDFVVERFERRFNVAAALGARVIGKDLGNGVGDAGRHLCGFALGTFRLVEPNFNHTQVGILQNGEVCALLHQRTRPLEDAFG